MEKKYFTCVFDVGDIRFRVSKDMRDPRDKEETPLEFHSHGEYEMFFIEKDGHVLHTQSGDVEYPYGSIVVVPPKFTHYSFKCVSTIIFSFEKKAKAKEKHYDIFKELVSQNEITEFKGANEYYWVWREIKNSFKFLLMGDFLRLKAVLQLLFIKLIQTGEYINRKSNSNIINASHIIIIDNFINDNLDQKLTIKDLAKELFLSERQVSRIINKNYGTTFSKLVMERRLVKAETLLDTDKSISEILGLVGFNSESNFFPLFKKRYGCSPSQYRKKYKSN